MGRRKIEYEITSETRKKCSDCGEFKLLDQFDIALKHSFGKQSYCKNCRIIRAKNRFNSASNRDSLLRSKYNINTEIYNRMYSFQGGRCFICSQKFELLHIDHNHETGKVRGLLCERCNKGLGCFMDNIDLLRMAIVYLEETNIELSRTK